MNKKNKKGSVLVFSLIILAMMLTIAMGLSSIGVTQKKDANVTQFSVQAYQIADSGAQLALKKINEAVVSADLNLRKVNIAFPGCVSNGGAAFIASPLIMGDGTSLSLSFLKADGVTKVACDDLVSDIANIKSTGTFRNTARAVDVAILSATAPIGWWKLDDGSADKALDSSGNKHEGTLIDGPSWVTGRIDGALSFDGNDDVVTLGNWFNYQTFSISMWLKPGTSQVPDANVIDNNSTDLTSWNFQQEGNTGRYIFRANSEILDEYCSVEGINLTTDSWQLVTIVREEGKVSVYRNETLLGSSTTNCDKLINYNNGSQSLRLGAWGGGGKHWTGQIDHVKIFDFALTADDVSVQYEEGAFKCLSVPPSYSTVYTDDSKNLVVDTAYSFSASNTSAKCEFKCNSGYTYKISTNTCEIIPIAPSTVDYLVVAGGGGGGGDGGGGGGAGGYRTGTGYSVTSGSVIAITVGNYGAGGGNNRNGSNGSDSVFGTITSIGGGGGAYSGNASLGGSGGGGPASDYGNGGSGTLGQGNRGGNTSSSHSGGSGGGGASAAGADSNSGDDGKSGGAGTSSSITGTAINYAGGGGGGGETGGIGGAGGIGGGGTGGVYRANGLAATANSGGGGGGAGYGANRSGGNGGSGVVIIRYPNTYADAVSTTGTVTFTNTGGYKIYKFTSSGSITF